MKTEPDKITALTLIEKVVEFSGMTFDDLTWTLEYPKDNPSRLIRLQQISVLLQIFLPDIYKAVPLPAAIKAVLSGHFLEDRKMDDYESIITEMDKVIARSKYPLKKDRDWDMQDIEFNYRKLMRYKIIATRLITFNSGILEIRYPYIYSVAVSDELSKAVKLKKIDSFLASVMDPARRTFSRSQLIKKYNYPKEDVYSVAEDNF